MLYKHAGRLGTSIRTNRFFLSSTPHDVVIERSASSNSTRPCCPSSVKLWRKATTKPQFWTSYKKRSCATDRLAFNRDRPTWIFMESSCWTYLSLRWFWVSIWSAWRTWTREAASLLPRTMDGWSFLQKALEKYQTEAPAVPTWKTQSCEWH